MSIGRIAGGVSRLTVPPAPVVQQSSGGGGGYTGPTPDTLAEFLYVWYNPAVAASVRTGVGGADPAAPTDPISELRDISGNNFHVAQAVSGNQPTYQTDNALPRVRFTLDDFLKRATDAPTEGFRVYACFQMDPASGANIIAAFRDNAFLQNGIAIFAQADQFGLYHAGGGTYLYAGASTTALSTMQALFRTAATCQLQIDGGTVASATIGADPTDMILLGGPNTGIVELVELFIAQDPNGLNNVDPLTSQQHTDMTAYIRRSRS